MKTPNIAPAPSSGMMLLVASARRNLRHVLNHPAFTKERREKAEALIATSTDAARLMKWKALAVAESEAWEDAQLKAEEARPGPPAHPEYNY